MTGCPFWSPIVRVTLISASCGKSLACAGAVNEAATPTFPSTDWISEHLITAGGIRGQVFDQLEVLRRAQSTAARDDDRRFAEVQLSLRAFDDLFHDNALGARVRGLPYRRILVRHALRNASGPALTILGNDFPLMLAGAVAAEAVFSLPGLGQLLLESAQTRDIPVVQGLLLVISTFVIVVNLVINTTLNWLYRADEVGA